MGNATDLEAVGAAAGLRAPSIQDTATACGRVDDRRLRRVLLDLAKTATDTKYQVRALRGDIPCSPVHPAHAQRVRLPRGARSGLPMTRRTCSRSHGALSERRHVEACRRAAKTGP